MYYGMIDVGDWQACVDLETGQPPAGGGRPRQAAVMAALAHNLRYPGDGLAALAWQQEAAQTLIRDFSPQWLMLAYTQPLFCEREEGDAAADPAGVRDKILGDIHELCRLGGYEPVIVLTGGSVPLIEEVRSFDTVGLLESMPWGGSLAGLSGAEPEDRAVLCAHPAVAQVVSREDILAAHPQAEDNFRAYLADYAIAAKPGYSFRGLNSHMVGRKLFTDVCESTVPVRCALGQPQHLRELYGLQRQALLAGRRVLLAVVEGFRLDDPLPAGFTPCANRTEWYDYRGLCQYLLLTTGHEFFETPYPPVYDRTKRVGGSGRWPYSGFFEEPPRDALGALPGLSTACVSSRSMIVHMASYAQVALECYSRDRVTMGTLAAFRDNGEERA